jgi:two-component system response regulator ArlR
MKILLIDDDENIGQSLKSFIQSKGAILDYEISARKGLEIIESENYDLLIVDFALPEINGQEIIKEIREHNMNLPIIAISVMDQVANKIKLLESGADYFVNKPFNSEELWATIKAAQRRSLFKRSNLDNLEYKGLVLDPEKFLVTYKSKKIELSAKEFDLLYFLLENQGRVLNRQEILEKVWDRNVDLFTNSIDVHICRIREKFNLVGLKDVIKTIKNRGYVVM